MVQVVDVNVDGPRGGNPAPCLKPAAAFSMSVRIEALGIVSGTHMFWVVVRNSRNRNVAVGVRVGKSDNGVVPVAGRASVSRLRWERLLMRAPLGKSYKRTC